MFVLLFILCSQKTNLRSGLLGDISIFPEVMARHLKGNPTLNNLFLNVCLMGWYNEICFAKETLFLIFPRSHNLHIFLEIIHFTLLHFRQ